MSVGTLLGVGASAGAPTAVVTVAATPSAAELIFLCFLSNNGANATPIGISAVSDSKGGTWAVSTSSVADIGYTDDSGLIIGAIIRTAGAALEAGDTITATWSVAAGFPPAHTALLCQGLRYAAAQVENQKFSVGGVCSTVYGNGNSFPGGTGTPTDILWGGFFAEPIPCAGRDVAIVSAAGGIGGASDWTPVNGSRVSDTMQAGGLYLAFCLIPAAPNLVAIQPGGSFAVGGTVTVANYQLLFRDPPTATPVFRTHHRAAR